nr:hypothetical protein [Croceivirga thetidis]
MFDFGLVVLIWLVQLIIYPGFQFYSFEKLGHWHPIYTNAISTVVIPLMLGQLSVVSIQIIKVRNVYTILSACGVVMVWLLTFLVFVPMHNEISMGIIQETTLKNLVAQNWYRTVAWSVLFLLNVLYFKAKYSNLR